MEVETKQLGRIVILAQNSDPTLVLKVLASQLARVASAAIRDGALFHSDISRSG
jgi:hypothetical protein